jgi:hypothetical protein
MSDPYYRTDHWRRLPLRRAAILAATKLGDTVLAAQAFQHDADLVFDREVFVASHDGCSSRLVPPVLSPARISVSSSLLERACAHRMIATSYSD